MTRPTYRDSWQGRDHVDTYEPDCMVERRGCQCAKHPQPIYSNSNGNTVAYRIPREEWHLYQDRDERNRTGLVSVDRCCECGIVVGPGAVRCLDCAFPEVVK